jgi:hypothetical protein
MKLKMMCATALCAILAGAAAQAQETHYSPEQQAAIKAYAHTLAVSAATFAAPVLAMYNLRDTVAVGPNAKVRPNHLWRLPTIETPKMSAEAGYVTPNVNVVYGFGFLDLSQEPIILTTPDSEGRYYLVEILDMWDIAFAYGAGKEVGYKGGKFALVGPGWKGELPPGVKRIDAPSRDSAPCLRQGRGRSPGRAESLERDNGAGPGRI